MLYKGWYPYVDNMKYLFGAAKTIEVKLGLDSADAAQFGHRLRLPLSSLLSGGHLLRLSVLGFTVKGADIFLLGVRGRLRRLQLDVRPIAQCDDSESSEDFGPPPPTHNLANGEWIRAD